MASTGLVESFVAAIQASLSVLLVIFYGGVAARLGLLNANSTKAISKVCVRLFLPALLFVKIGSELHSGSAHRYVVVLVWAIVCHAISFVLGIAGHLLFGMPDWTTVAVMFNNTTSYPLLLVSALDQTGILQALVVNQDETTRQAIERAKSYFLVFSTVSSCLTFAVGPRLIDTEHAPEPGDGDEEEEPEAKADEIHDADETPTINLNQPSRAFDTSSSSGADSYDEGDGTTADHLFDEYQPAAGPSEHNESRPVSRSSGYDPLSDAPPHSQNYRYGNATETTGLLSPYTTPGTSRPLTFRASVVKFIDPFASSANAFFPSIRHKSKSKQPSAGTPNGVFGNPPPSAYSSAKNSVDTFNRRVSVVPRSSWRKLGPRTQWWLLFIADFFNAPLLGALAGAVVGLTPLLHRAFFSPSADGGIFTAWLTASLDDIGSLFVPLPVVVAGVSLYTAMNGTRKESASLSSLSSSPSNSKRLPVPAVIYILVLRFIVWPVASVATIYLLASRTDLVGSDPMLWFALMLMPTGPPAMKLITLVQVSDADADDETSIAKLLTISYLISPVLSFTVVASLRASLASL
ncbi:auxin efflux carrier superfamily [Ophiostoma piceae UAMH 11346]|uniref:Auxin efflux carrier superfamily n=1 Tax=Ophiostoma piceae (strain UAMH 11346) TaxID=1262450 RepID=S3DAK7_OPHP1|nr:auxin efflux carrier superfamily [Ophiostoma piceae UAMH 11346]